MIFSTFGKICIYRSLQDKIENAAQTSNKIKLKNTY